MIRQSAPAWGQGAVDPTWSTAIATGHDDSSGPRPPSRFSSGPSNDKTRRTRRASVAGMGARVLCGERAAAVCGQDG